MLHELQHYLRHAAAQHREVVRSGPFGIAFDALSDQPYANYAIPDDGAQPDEADVAALVATFASRDRIPALEYIPMCAPAALEPLLAGGLRVSERITIMGCPPAQLADVPDPAGVEVVIASAETPDALIREVVAVQRRAFGGAGTVIQAEDVDRFRLHAGEGVAAYAVDTAGAGRVLGGGVAVVIRDGLTELAGIGVAEGARGRGVGVALTAALTRTAIQRGAHLPFLTRAGESAGRVYERAGFRDMGGMLHLAGRASVDV